MHERAKSGGGGCSGEAMDLFYVLVNTNKLIVLSLLSYKCYLSDGRVRWHHIPQFCIGRHGPWRS